MKNDTFEAYREQMEDEYELALQGKVVCKGCGEVKDQTEVISSATDGTLCFDCLY